MKAAVVTGASSGLGTALVDVLLDDGWHVLGVSRRGYRPTLAKAADRYEDISCDLRQVEELPRLMRRIEDLLNKQGQLDEFMLVNNAGVLSPVGGVSRATPAELADAYAVNTVSPTWLMDAVARNVAESPVSIVNVSSGAALNPYPGWQAYCATKAALQMAGRVCFAELEQGVIARSTPLRLVSYAPGVVDTPMQEQVRTSPAAQFPGVQRFVDLHQRGELVRPRDAAMFLCRLLAEPFTQHCYHEVRYQP